MDTRTPISYLNWRLRLITGSALLRVGKQPYSRTIKLDQAESIFKGTTLAAVVVGIAINGKINKPRSSGNRSTP